MQNSAWSLAPVLVSCFSLFRICLILAVSPLFLLSFLCCKLQHMLLKKIYLIASSVCFSVVCAELERLTFNTLIGVWSLTFLFAVLLATGSVPVSS